MLNIAVLAFLCIVGAVAQTPFDKPSVPTFGQYARFRGAPRGSLLSLQPLDGAEFIVGQHFDISIELHQENSSVSPVLSGFSTSINSSPLDSFFGSSWVTNDSFSKWTFTYSVDGKAARAGQKTTVAATRYALRGVSFKEPGTYDVTIITDGQVVSARWTVRSFAEKKAKNLAFFIGDGMGPGMVAAARYLSRATRFGKFGSNFLEMETLGSIGRIITNGYDSIITDSANSAAAYNTGHKAAVNALGSYSDTSSSSDDDPKVETLAEIIRRERPGMCVGVVTTAEIQDATPAAVWAHTRLRSAKGQISEQLIHGWNLPAANYSWDVKPVKADVVLGGGGASIIPSGAYTGQYGRIDYDAFKNANYTIINTGTELRNYKGDQPLFGIFTKVNMETWLDRTVYPSNLATANSNPTGGAGANTDQPSLEEMVSVAIEVMDKRCGAEGWFLMAEGASIDKSMHPLDFDRGLADLLELDRAVRLVKDYGKRNGDNTAIILTADHAQGYDVSGSVDKEFFDSQPIDDTFYSKRLALGVYATAGWPNYVVDSNGLPTKWENRFRMLGSKVDSPGYNEDYKVTTKPVAGSPLARSPTVSKIVNGITAYFANPADAPNGLARAATLSPRESTSVHTLAAVDLFCHLPGALKYLCSRVIDNTELFFIMAEVLGLGKPATLPPSTTTVTSETQSATATSAATSETAAATTTAPPPVTTAETTSPAVTGTDTSAIVTSAATSAAETSAATSAVATSAATSAVETSAATSGVETSAATSAVATSAATSAVETSAATSAVATSAATSAVETSAATSAVATSAATSAVETSAATSAVATSAATSAVETSAGSSAVATSAATSAVTSVAVSSAVTSASVPTGTPSVSDATTTSTPCTTSGSGTVSGGETTTTVSSATDVTTASVSATSSTPCTTTTPTETTTPGTVSGGASSSTPCDTTTPTVGPTTTPSGNVEPTNGGGDYPGNPGNGYETSTPGDVAGENPSTSTPCDEASTPGAVQPTDANYTPGYPEGGYPEGEGYTTGTPTATPAVEGGNEGTPCSETPVGTPGYGGEDTEVEGANTSSTPSSGADAAYLSAGGSSNATLIAAISIPAGLLVVGSVIGAAVLARRRANGARNANHA
ncbi:alkaline-phosphatase-like protein [Cladochytrium replicatum]|nr:alkaline-phosphatase-like protein [Cladochytrium replicatum]